MGKIGACVDVRLGDRWAFDIIREMLELRGIGLEVADERKGMRKVLHGVDLRVKPGDLVVVTGPNGSGKTSLARVMMGLLKPSWGEVWLGGENVTNEGVTERARKGLGLAWQQPVRFKGLTVEDLLSMAAGRKLEEAEVAEVLETVGLGERYGERRLDGKLSGGEMKRIEVAMLVLRETKVAVFDEPEAGVDLWSFDQLLGVLAKIRERTDSAMVIISHQRRILRLADEIVVMREGSIERQGTTEEVLPDLLCKTEVER